MFVTRPDDPFFWVKDLIGEYKAFFQKNKEFVNILLNHIKESVEQEDTFDSGEKFEYHEIDVKKVQELNNKLLRFSDKFKKEGLKINHRVSNLPFLSSLVYMERGNKEKKNLLYKKIKNLMDETVRFELQSKIAPLYSFIFCLKYII